MSGSSATINNDTSSPSELNESNKSLLQNLLTQVDKLSQQTVALSGKVSAFETDKGASSSGAAERDSADSRSQLTSSSSSSAEVLPGSMSSSSSSPVPALREMSTEQRNAYIRALASSTTTASSADLLAYSVPTNSASPRSQMSMDEFLNGETVFTQYPTLEDLQASRASRIEGVSIQFSKELIRYKTLVEDKFPFITRDLVNTTCMTYRNNKTTRKKKASCDVQLQNYSGQGYRKSKTVHGHLTICKFSCEYTILIRSKRIYNKRDCLARYSRPRIELLFNQIYNLLQTLPPSVFIL